MYNLVILTDPETYCFKVGADHEAIDPLQTAVEMLGSSDITLISDVTLIFIVTQFCDTEMTISNKLYDTLRRRITERRTEMFGYLKYSHSPSTDDESVSKTKRPRIQRVIRELVERLELV